MPFIITHSTHEEKNLELLVDHSNISGVGPRSGGGGRGAPYLHKHPYVIIK
jgi:hypothetical protein